MNTKNTFVKKLTALVLCLCMVLPMVTTGFAPMMALLDGIAPQAEATVTEKGKVAFYVPEVIYLYPNLQSWTTSTATPFQYYIENTVNTSNIYAQPTTNTVLRKGGTIYFAAENGFSDVSITHRFMDERFNTITGGSITVGSFSNSSSYGTFSITDGKSPSLSATTTGCYIEWTVSYTNNAGERLSAIAYTYVYKPYVIPYGTAARVKNSDGLNDWTSFAQSISWVSGVHNISANGNRYAKFTTTSSGTGLSPFLSDDATGYNGSTALTGTQVQLSSTTTYDANARRMYAVFATTDAATSYFKANQTNNGISNAGAEGWFNTANSGTYNIATFDYDNYENGANNIYMQIESASDGEIYIDTSRYENLNQIPNLGVGLLVTDDQRSKGSSGTWYVADATGKDGLVDYSTTNEDNSRKYYNYKGTVMAGQGYSPMDTAYSEVEGIKYAGAWVCSITDRDSVSVSKTYSAKTFYGNEQQKGDEYLSQAGVMHLVATQQNKSTLRTAVNNALASFGTLGVTAGYNGHYLGSYYYDVNSAAWQRFENAYKAAYLGLTKLDGAVDVATLTNNLNNAVTALKNGQGRIIYFDVNYGGIKPNLYILPTGSVTSNGVTITVNKNTDSVTFSGTSTANAYPFNTQFTPVAGTYTYSGSIISGSFSGKGCTVLEAHTAAGQQLGNRLKVDVSGSSFASSAAVSATDAPNVKTANLWVWQSSEGAGTYNNLTVQYKIEAGGTNTAYSPTARVAPSNTGVTTGSYGELPTPTRTGFTFAGWYAEPACTNKIESSTTVSSTTVYAKWTPNEQTLTIDTNGGVNSANLIYNPNGLQSFSGGSDTSLSYNIAFDENGAVDIYGNYTGGVTERTSKVDLWVYLEYGKMYEYSFTSTNDFTEFYMFPNGEVKNFASLNRKTNNSTTYGGQFVCGGSGAVGDNNWNGVTTATGWYQLRLDQDCKTTSEAVVTAYEISDFVIREVTPDAVSQYKQPTDTKKYIPDPVRGGYTFNGWTGNTENLGTDKYYTFKSGSNSLVANWTANTYTLTLDADGGTFTYDGAAVGSADIAYTAASTYTLPEPTKAGYEFARWYVESTDGNWPTDATSILSHGDAITGFYGNTTLKAIWAPLDVNYQVEHYQMNIDGSTYDLKETENKTGEVDSAAEFAAKTYEGFTYSHAEVNGTTVTSATIAGDGSLVIKLYYTRNKYKVTTSVNNDKAFASVTGAGEYYYGASVTLTANVKAGYSFTNWTKDGTSDANTSTSFSFEIGAADVAWTANATANQVNYTVVHKYETLTDGVYDEETQTLTAEADSSVTPAFVNKTGFTAVGNTQTVTVKGDGTTKVTYTYTRNSYKFTTNVDGVTIVTEYKYGADVTAPTAPTKVGYTFAGWDGTVPLTMPANDITVTATWNVNTHTIIYMVDGAEVQKYEKVPYGSAVTAYTYTAPRGYEFNGWTGEIPATMPDSDLTINGTTTKLTYTIKATLNGGSINNDFTEYETTYQVDTAKFVIPDPVKTGFTFTGWTENGTNLGKNLTINPTDTSFNLRNMNLVATWAAAQVNYTVETYVMGTDGNYGTPTTETKQGLTGDPATADTTAKTGFTLDTTHADYLTSGTIKADGSLVLKVFYKRNQYTVTLTAGTGVESVAGAGTFYYEAPVAISATLKDGYENLKWSGTVPDTMPNNDVNLTATASPIGYTISYDLAGGAVSGTNQTTYNVESADIILVNPTRTGYTFAGWTGTDLAAATQTVTIAKGSTGNRSYTATWTPVTYTITYTLNDGTVATANPTEYTIESAAITLNNPTRQGYAFAGWTGTGLDAATETVTIATGSTGNRSYTATWTESNADYTVKHYRQNLDGTYTTLLETEVISSTTGKTETAAVKSYDGFTAPEAVEVTVLADGSATVEYYYTRNSYKIVYYTVNAADAQIEFKTIEALYEAPVTAITDVPTRTGYAFTKWDVACPATMPLNGLEITALWNPSTFTITYEDIYDDVSRYPASHTFDTETDISAVPARDGYTFAGWQFNGNPITFENNKIGKRQFSSNFTLTATWTPKPTTYTVETYLMGTDGKYPETATSSETKATETDKPITAAHEAKTGFTVDTEKSVLSGTAAWDGSSVLKLYYSRNQYDLTLEAGTGIAEVTGAKQYYYQESVTVNASMLAGYDWDKWTKGDADFAAAQNYTFTMPAEALTVKANAKLHIYNINITLNNGAFAAGYTAPTSYDVTKEDITIPDPTRTGYTFNGWLVNGANAPQQNYTIDTALAVDVELVADWTAIEYKISYVLSGGTNAESNPDTYTVESAEIKLASPTRTGYEFIKWTEGDTIAAGSTGNKTFTAEWEALGVEYTVNVYKQGFYGEYHGPSVVKFSAPADSVVTAAELATDPALVTTGYSFDFAKDTADQKINSFTVEADGSTVVNFYFRVHKYTVAFDANGGTGTMNKMVSYPYGLDFNLNSNTFTYEGFTFLGWNTKSDGSGTAYADGAFVRSLTAEDNVTITLYAQWDINEYTITFANTGDSTIAPITQDYNTAVTAPANPTKTGYTFDGWDKEIPATMPAENVTITANWTINQYTVTFDTDGGSEIVPITQDYATEITKPADPTKEGYTFTGWDTAIPEFMPANNVTVKAQWEINQYTVTFDTDGGSEIAPITQDYATEITKPADPTKVGYTFDGWDTEIPDTMPAENMTVTAKWKINQYTITFESNGGSVVNAIKQDYNTTVTAPSNPTRPGYEFTGWDKEIPAKMPAENTIITALWKIVNYPISYELGGGENHADNPTTYTYEQSFTLKAPTKVGYTFAGWIPDGTIALHSTGDKTFTANWTPNTDTHITVEYYIQPVKVNAEQAEYTLHSTDKAQVGTSDAQKEVTPIAIDGFTAPAKQTVTVKADGSTVVKFYYTRNSYTVTFDSKGGSAVGSITALYEAPVTAPANPTKTGYTFKEWTPALAGKMPVGGQNVEAVWTANTYTVTYDYSVSENVTVTHTGNVPNAHTYGTATPVSDPERAGYTFAGWTINGTIAGGTDLTLAADGYTADITLKANWTADKQKYTVVYYDENLNGEYVEVNRTTENEAETDSTVTLTPAETKTGFTLNTEKSVLSGAVPVPGTTLELSVYYSRNTYKLTWSVEGVATTESYKYEQAITYLENPTKTGYNFIGWNPSNVTTMPAEDITLTAQFAAADDTEYKVIHKLEDLNADTYSEKETELLYGTTASEVTPEVKSYEGFTAPTTQTVTIAADGSTQVVYEYTRNSYDVTIVATDAGLSNATESQKVEFEGTLNVSVTVANGYEFKGWTSDNANVAGSNVASYTITMPASAVTLTANAEIIKYTVEYNLNDGALADGKTNPTEFYVTTDTFTLNNPEKKGYTFLGWTGSNGTVAQTEVSVEKGTYENLSYTANWALIPYEIKYDLAGGSVAQANATQYYVTTATFTLNNPTKAGYTFTGWTGTDLSGNVETVTITTGSIGDRSYTATWEANDIKTVVNYYWQNIDDDNYTLKDTVNGTVKNDTVFAPEVETYEGFVSPAAQSVKVENGVAVTIDYYYDRETHIVTLAAGTGIDSVSGAGTYRYGKEITVSAVVSTGYTWQNWTAAGTEASATQNYTITIGTADVALTANATLDTYTITYSGLDQYTTVIENPASYNVHSDAIDLNNPAKDGYTFTGWTGTDLSEQTMTVTIPTGSVGNRSYTANWSVNTYNLTYDLANGSLAEGVSIPATYTVDDVITLPTPVRTGYTFKGWSDGATTAMTVKLERATGDRSYVAVWEANTDTKYTVKHYLMDLNGQYSAIAYETREFSDGISDADVTPAVKAYEGFTAPETQTVTVKPDGTTVVEYFYSRNKYALTYYTVEGQRLQTQDLYFDATIPVAPTATRDGYTFKEWNAEIPAKMPAHAVEITALWNVNTYTVSFNVNGGNALTAINYNIETAVTLPEATRSGYDFAGWTVNQTAGNWADSIAENNATLAAGLWGDVTLSANWTARQDTPYVVKHMFMNVDGTAYEEFKVENFTGESDSKVTPAVLTGDDVIGFTAPEAREVTIEADGSTVVVYEYKRNQYNLTWVVKGSADETVKYYYGAAVTAKASPELAGYTFTGWSSEIPATMPAEDVTITANFDLITYKITIDYNGGKEVDNKTTYTVETETFTLINPTRDGYTFAGWEGTDNGETVTIAKGSTGDRNYKAKWNADEQKWYVDVYYMTTEGKYNDAADENIEKTNVTDTPVSFDPTTKLKDGFTFDAANSSISGKVPGTGELRLTAKYSRNQYTVTYDFANGADKKSVTTYYEADLAAVAEPTRTGYTFAGWYDANGNKVDALPATMPLNGGTYTARWTANEYKLTFVENGGTEVADITYTIESADVLPTISRAGYTFNGWLVTTAGGSWTTTDANYAAGTTLTGKYGSATLTAQWTARNDTTYVVKHLFMATDGTTYVEDETKRVNATGTSDTMVTPAVLNVTGFTAPEAEEVLIKADGSTVVEYKYSRNQYNLTWVIKGSADETVKYYYDAAVEAKADPELKGHTFTGWSRSIPAKMPAEDVTITANFNIITYYISIDYNGAQAVNNPTEYNVETATFTLINPTRDGYEFLGWTGSNGETAQKEVTIPVGSTGDKTYKAMWDAEEQEWYVDVYYMDIYGEYAESPNTTLTFKADTDTPVSYDLAKSLKDGFTADAANSVVGETKVLPDNGLHLIAKYSRNKYTVTIDPANGQDKTVINDYYEKAFTAPAKPVRTGYTFNGWSSEIPATIPLGGGTYTAQWDADEYVLTLVENGGTAVDDITYTIESADVLPTISRAGYFFEGWLVTTADGCWTTADANYAAGTALKGKYGSATLTAQWTTVQYTLEFNTTHGTVDPASITYTVEDTTNALPTPVRPGYTFTGWLVTEVSDDTQSPGYIYWKVDQVYDAGTKLTDTYGNAKFTAQWQKNTYSVNADAANITYTGANEATVDVDYTATLAPHAGYTLPDTITVTIGGKEAIVNTDYTYTVNEEDGTATLTVKGAAIIGDIAIKVVRNIITYTISYDLDKATTDPKNETTYNVETEVNLTAPERAGYTFLGWTGSNGDTPETTVTIPVGTTGDKEYVANWKANNQDWFVDVYYMNTDGEYKKDADVSIKYTNVTDTPVSFDSDERLLAGFVFDAANSKLTGTVPGTGTLRLTAKYIRQQYTVTYNFENGAENKVVKTYYDAALEAVANPTRTGYTFAGWVNSNGDKVTLPEKMPLNGETYTATWTVNSYTLTLDENGGTAVEDITYTIESAAALPTLSRAGYSFAGWKVTTAGGSWTAGANHAAGTSLKGTHGSATLTAQWTPVQYTLAFNADKGTVDPASVTYTVEDTTHVLPTPVRPGYTFTGWKVTEVSDDTQSAGYIYWEVGKTYAAGTKLTDTYGNAKFEAQWQENTYNVTVDAANITFTGEATATVDVDYTATLTPIAGYTLPDSITVTVGGNEIFVGTGYTYTVNADGTATLEIDGAYIIGEVEIKVVREIITYEISYDYANATVKPANPASYNVETATITLIAPERTGYTFLGWTGSNGTTAQTEVTIPVGTTGNKEYVANWQADPRQYTVEIYYMTTDGTYNNTPDKSWTVDSVTDAQVAYNINDPATLLTGFSANESISTLTGKVPATGALTLVAKYDRNKYALTVNGCEGITVATGTVEYFYDKEIIVDATVAMGYTWDEWKSEDETVLANSTDKKYVFRMPANAATLTAVATLDEYAISYDLAGGSLAEGVTNPASYNVTSETFTLNNPTKVGYDFIGWTGTDVATPTMTVTVEKNSTTGDKHYTANWKAIEYTVSYDLDEGTAQGNNYTKYTIESAAQTLTAPVKTGYTFLGWTGSNGTDPETDVTIAGGTIGNLSFTANWTADAHTYTVEYRTQTTEGVYAEQPDKTETITSYTDAEVSVEVKPEMGFYIADTSILSGTVKHDNSLVLKVYIGREQYNVNLVDGGDGISSVNANSDLVYFDALVEVNAAVEKGYTFEKWTSKDATVLADSTNNPYTFKMPAGDVTLTATATLDEYKINYTLNDGTNDAANPATYTVLDTVVIKQPTRLGYTFTGWTGTYEGKDVTIAAGTIGEINLTANWSINTYTVTYNLDGGTVSGNPSSYNVTDSFTLYNPTKVGYDFVGWKGTGIDGTQENVTVSAGTTGNLEFTAVWAARPDTKYTVNYYLENVNGDQTYTLGADSFVGEYYSDQQITPNVPVYTGFTTPVAQTKVVNADGTTVFNFYYERNIYTYTFKAIGYEDDVYKYYYEYPVAKPTDPVRNGYTFEGWNPVVFSTMPAYDVTSVAQWKAITYTVGYNLNGGSVTGNPTTYTVENGFTLVNPTRTGYDFAGWTGTGLTEPTMLVRVEAGSIGNRSYTATWTPVRYEITYDFAGGTDNGENPISYTIEDSITLVNPTRVGYTFAGWKGTGIAGTSMVVSFRNTTGARSYTATWRANNNTLYTVLHYQQDIGTNTYTLFETEELYGTTMTEAMPKVRTYPGFTSPTAKTVTILPDGSAKVEYYYTRNTYTIFFDSNGGSAVSSKTFAFGEPLTGIETPSYLGYTFAGWIPALPETMTAGNLYVTADWKPNTDTPYTVYHYFQDVDCVSYPEELMKTEYCYGETGAIVEVATWDVEGFTAPEKRSIVIAADGSRTVRYYYTRNTYTVTFVDHNDNIIELQSVVYGLPATPPVLEDRAPDAEGHYTFAGWSEDTSFIHGYTTIKAMHTAEAHNPGAEADCTNALVCTVCGYEIAPANGHMPVVQTPAVEATCTTAGNTADSVCSVCGEVLSRYSVIAPLGHEIGSWYVDVPATATTTGILKRVCSRCDWSETHEIPILSDTPVVSIDITTQGSQAYVGTNYQLKTSIKPANAGNKQVIWESSDPSVASVTNDGYITSHKPGEVTFTVTTLDGLKTDSITINFFYSADHYDLIVLDLFACNLTLDGKPLEATTGQIIRVKAGSTLAFTIDPTTAEYLEQGGYIFTANGSNVEADANGVYYIYNVHENIEISALPAIGKPEFDDDQQYDTDEVPEKSIFAKILAFFERIIEWFRNLFK